MTQETAPPSLNETLTSVGDQLVQDLDRLFGHRDVQVAIERQAGELVLRLSGPGGSFTVSWPPREQLTRAEGRLGAHARIALEFHLASHAPGQFFRDYRPVSPQRRRIVFDQLEGYIEETLGNGGFYGQVLVEERGAALLVYCDDEYVIVSDAGQRRGHGLLDWKVKRLLSYALTDADEELD